jgi:hypothetical protein
MFDQPGKLYLGREYDLDDQRPTDTPILLSARDLTTHAVCLGMTGTGKTGLGVVVLEEALLQGVPCIIVDPKGDITNLALNFPSLAPDDFRPWLDEDEAERQGMTLDQEMAHWAGGMGYRAGAHRRTARPGQVRHLYARQRRRHPGQRLAEPGPSERSEHFMGQEHRDATRAHLTDRASCSRAGWGRS